MALPARITTLYSGSVAVQLSGELDLVSAPALNGQFDEALQLSPDLVVDLHEVTFLDAAVITTLLRAQQQALSLHGSLVLVGATAWVEKVLHASRATEAIPLLPLQQGEGRSAQGDVSRISAWRNRRTVC